MRIGIVTGTVRPNNIGTSIAQWVTGQANTVEGVEAELVEIKDYALPLFDEPLPPAFAAPQNPVAVAWNAKISSFDALIFVTPEYNHSISGALKNAIDYLTPAALANKGVGLVGYSYTGGIRPVEHLRQIFANFDAAVVNAQVALSLATDVADGAFAPAAYHEGEVPAVVNAIVTRSAALR